MVEKGLTKRNFEQAFKGFEKRQDEKMNAFEKRVVDQFHIISGGLIDQIKLLAGGHSGIINRLDSPPTKSLSFKGGIGGPSGRRLLIPLVLCVSSMFSLMALTAS
jgi:hypothetical protein